MAEADRHALRSFLSELHQLLTLVADEPHRWIPPELWQSMQAAWREVEPRFSVVAAELQNSQHDAALENAGLTGASLTFKIAGWRRVFERFLRRQGRRTLRLALKWANAALGSLAKIIGAAEPIKEFKEALEAQTEEQLPRGRWEPA